MSGIPFQEAELQVKETFLAPVGRKPIDRFTTPISDKEAVKRMFRREPVWQCCGMGVEYFSFNPAVNPDNIARAYVIDATARKDKQGQAGGKDMFGIEWEYEPSVGGSMVRPGNVFAETADELLEKTVWPDVDAWDWAGSAEANKNFLSKEKFNIVWFMNGWYERLIAMMGFENAAVAMIDEEQQDDVKTFFDKLTDLYIRIAEHYIESYPGLDGFYVHDDWGSQRETFFAPSVAKEMIVPYMRRFTDFLHSKGLFCDLHSCGMNMRQVPNFIEAGWDSWRPQLMNDAGELYELYGDKIIIAVPPETYDPETTSPEEQRAYARAYAEKYCKPGRPSMFSMYGTPMMTHDFCEELYKQSRILYGELA